VKGFIVILILGTTFFACHKPDDPVLLIPTKGNIKSAQIKMGSNYVNQIYYTLENDSMRSNDFLLWDLAFECSSDGFHIIINGGKEVQTYNSGITNFTAVNSIATEPKWKWDNPAGELSQTAIGFWIDTIKSISKQEVYVIDRGMNEPERYKKIIFQSVDPDYYTVFFANLDGSGANLLRIDKIKNKNYVYLNLNNIPVIYDLEPDKNSWDLLFTRYRHIYYDMDPIAPYSVTGVLLNPFNTTVYRDSVLGFDKIDLPFAMSITLTNESNAIGFDWKTYDFSAARYVVRPDLTYIIKSNTGLYYKLRFVDFYDDQGLKGAPRFQIQKL